MAIKAQKILSMEDAMSNLLFGSVQQAKEENNSKSDLIEIPYEKLVYYKDQHYRMYTSEEAQRTIDSIKQVGVLEPPIVRPLENGVYEVLAGRNRTECAKLAGIPAMPCKVIEADDETAVLIVNATNLCRRESVSVMEKAWGYRQMLESLEKSGKQKTISAIAETMEESRKQIYRYIRLTYLIEPIQKLIDTGEVTRTTGYILSFISPNNQKVIAKHLENLRRKFTPKEASLLKDFCDENDCITQDDIITVLSPKVSEDEMEVKRKYTKINLSELQPLLCSKGLISNDELSSLKPKKLQQKLTEIIISLLENQ